MMRIQYKISNKFNWQEKIHAGVEIDEIAIGYDLFLGSLEIAYESQLIYMDWEWIPLVDFASFILEVSHTAFSGKKVFEFTESEATILFYKDKGDILIAPSFSPINLRVPQSQFQGEVLRFYDSLISDIIEKFPRLKNSPAFQKYLLKAS